MKYSSGDSSLGLTEQVQAINDRPDIKLGVPELVLNKLGYWSHPFLQAPSSQLDSIDHNTDPRLYRFTTFLFGSPYLFFSTVCLQYCDADSCRFYRDSVWCWIAIIFSLLMMRWIYLGFLGRDIRSKSLSDAPSPDSP